MSCVHALSGDQIRQTIDTEQIFAEWSRVSDEISHRYRGAMAWKTVSGRRYLYRKLNSVWKSMGPESDHTMQIYQQFHDSRDASKSRLQALLSRLDEMAAINRVMRLGRVPLLTARILRAIGRSGLVGTALNVVGANALYVYERLSGLRIESGMLATGDVDMPFDARAKLKLLGKQDGPASLLRMLQAVDKSFLPIVQSSFRAANKDGFLVDLIMPAAKLSSPGRTGIGKPEEDLVAVEIEGLQWLVNSPKVKAVLLDIRGYPLVISSPDPRAFAMHKLWLSKREDRDPLKRVRDRQQAELVSGLLATQLTKPAANRGLEPDW